MGRLLWARFSLSFVQQPHRLVSLNQTIVERIGRWLGWTPLSNSWGGGNAGVLFHYLSPPCDILYPTALQESGHRT